MRRKSPQPIELARDDLARAGGDIEIPDHTAGCSRACPTHTGPTPSLDGNPGE